MNKNDRFTITHYKILKKRKMKPYELRNAITTQAIRHAQSIIIHITQANIHDINVPTYGEKRKKNEQNEFTCKLNAIWA